MQELTSRQKDILEAVVNEYIKTALPISSDFLKNEGCFDVSPATIRLELAELATKGFLEKPYISGGRVPTDKGYRFFVNEVLEKTEQEKIKLKKIRESFCLTEQFENSFKFFQEVAKELADFSSNLSVVFSDELNITVKDGWETVAQAPEFSHIDYFKNFAALVRDFENRIKGMNFTSGKTLKIYIGKESPFRNKNFSIIIGQEKIGKRSKNKAIFAILGPKRMDFKKNIFLMNSLFKILAEC